MINFAISGRIQATHLHKDHKTQRLFIKSRNEIVHTVGQWIYWTWRSRNLCREPCRTTYTCKSWTYSPHDHQRLASNKEGEYWMNYRRSWFQLSNYSGGRTTRNMKGEKEEHMDCSTTMKKPDWTIEEKATFMNNTSTLSYSRILLLFLFYSFFTWVSFIELNQR